MTNGFPLMLKTAQANYRAKGHWTSDEIEAGKSSIARHHKSFCNAAAVLDAAVAAKVITNVDFKTIKETFNYALHDLDLPRHGDIDTYCLYIHAIPGLLKRARKAGAPWVDVLEEILPVSIAMETIQGKVNGKQVGETMVVKRQPKPVEEQKVGYIRPAVTTEAQAQVRGVLEEITQAAYDAMVAEEKADLLARARGILNNLPANTSLKTWLATRLEEIKTAYPANRHHIIEDRMKAKRFWLETNQVNDNFQFASDYVVSVTEVARLRADASEIAERAAKAEIDARRTFFVTRNLRKLAPICDAMKNGFTVTSISNGRQVNGFESELVAKGARGASFSTRLQYVGAHSVLGKAFVRAPLIFRDVTLPGGAKMERTSEKRMNEVFAKAF